MADTIINMYRFSSNNELVEYSKIWIGEKDTMQINSYFFDKENLIKALTRSPFDSYIQFAYLESENIIYAMDNEGKINPNADHYLKDSRQILRSARVKSEFVK